MANKVQHGSSLTNSGTNGSGVTYTSFAYDSNGNTTHDGRTCQDLTWNMLNLISGVSKTAGGTTTQLASYNWYADGSKYSALRADGSGYVYKGDLVYERSASGTLSLDCVLTTGGRIVANKNSSGTITGYTVYHHITDHLGSVRAITNASTGNVVETSDFLPFGTRWSQTAGSSSSTLTDATNRWRYSGKEEQKAINSTLPLIDYGARMYDPTIARWMSIDPMAEKYYPMSPYGYCAGNPIIIVDADGKVPHVIVGALVGGGINAAIALYQGKTGKEFWGAVGGGAVEGAITAATGGVGMLSKGAKIVRGVMVGAIGGAAGSATEQYITTETVDLKQTAVDGASGAISGGASASIISSTKGKVIDRINQKYSSAETRKAIYKEVKKEVNNTGQPIGKSTRQRINKEVEQRAKDLNNTDLAVTEAATYIVDEGQKRAVNYVSNKISNVTDEL